MMMLLYGAMSCISTWLRANCGLREMYCSARMGRKFGGAIFLTYNLETGEGSFTEAHSEVELAEKTGIIFVTGSSVQLTDRAYQVADAQFTTCDLENSHYHVEAKELELLVGEKVIIRRVTYYEGKIPPFLLALSGHPPWIRMRKNGSFLCPSLVLVSGKGIS